MSDLVERLRKPSDGEETMSHWDTLRAYLLKGGRGSYARDIFEALLGHIDEEREEAADRIASLEKENAELRQLADDSLHDAARITNEKTDYWLRIHAMEKALSFILSLEISPASNEHSGAENGKQLLRARSAVRQAITMEDIHREQRAVPRIRPARARLASTERSGE